MTKDRVAPELEGDLSRWFPFRRDCTLFGSRGGIGGVSMATLNETVGRPWALSVLWVAFMAPLSIAGTVVQPHTPIPYEAFPLVMAGPALAAGLCYLMVPSWFPPSPSSAPRRRWVGSLLAIVVCGAAFVIVIAPFGAGRPAIIPHHQPVWGAVAVVVVGIFVGSLLEEIGYRGVMYRALSARLAPLASVAVNGLFFGLCHLQYFAEGWVPVLLFLASAVLIDVCMVAVWTGSWTQRIVVAGVFHGAVNIGLQLFGVAADRALDFVGLTAGLTVSAVLATVVGRRLGLGDFADRPPVPPARNRTTEAL